MLLKLYECNFVCVCKRKEVVVVVKKFQGKDQGETK